MESSVIEKDPVEVKKYMANFVPINNYRSLGDEYLYQVRATLLHSGSGTNLFSARYEDMFNEIKISVGDNSARISSQQEVWADLFSAGAKRTDILEAHASNSSAAIEEIREATASTNAAQAKINTKLQASFDDIIVGGRNLIVNSTFAKGYDTWSESVITPTDHYIGKMHRIAPKGDKGSTYGIMPLDKFKRIRLVQGTQYSLSFYGFGSVLLLDQVYLVSAEGDLTKLPNITMSTDLTERRHITFTAPIGGDGIGFIIGATSGSTEDWFSISQLKLELGTKPTDWTPAPEDVDGYISEVQSTIDDFKEVQISRNEATATAIQALDSRVGDNTSSILSERKTNANRYSTLTQTTDRLSGATGENKARIEEVNTVITNKYETVASKITTLEAETELGKGKIENLEEVTSNTQEVVATTSKNLNAKIEGIGIGGRNLLRNANFKLGHKLWGTAASTESENILGNLITVTNVGDETTYFGFGPEDRYKTIHLVAGREYVLSFYAEGSIPALNDIWISSEGNGVIKLPDVPLTTSLGERTELVFISEFTAENCTILIGANSASTNDWFGVVAVKLEQGNKATDWTEAPEDTRQAIETVEANINEFRQVQVDHNKATTTAINTMESTLGENSAKIVENYNTLVSKDESMAKLHTSLSADYGLNKTKVSNEIKAVADDVSASVESISTLKAEFEGNKAGVDSSLKSLATENTAQTKRMDNLYADIGVNSAAIASEVLARTTEDEAIVKSVTELSTRTKDAEGRISKAETAISTNSGAMAQQKTDLTAAYTKAIDDIEIGGRNLFILNDFVALAPDKMYRKNGSKLTILKIDTYAGYAIGQLEADTDYVLTSSVPMEDRLRGAAKKRIEGNSIYFSTDKNNTEVTFKFLPVGFTEDISFPLDVYIKLERGNKPTDWTPAPEDTISYIDSEIATVITKVESKADISRVDTVESNAEKALASAKTELTGEYSTAITTAKKQSADDAQAKADAASKSAKDYTDQKIVIVNEVIDSKADISRVDSIENSTKESIATAKTELTGSFTQTITETVVSGEEYARLQAEEALKQAKLDATAKASDAKSAAEIYAAAQAEAKRIEAEAYADGIVTAEEERAIEDARLKLEQAKTDATAKANAAELAAKQAAALDATAKANKALLDAKADSKLKADAAKEAAQKYAETQAEAKRVLAEAYADGIVTDEEQKRIDDVNAKLALAKKDATDKAEAAKQAAITAAALDATQKANQAKKDANEYTLVKFTEADASIKEIKQITNNANQSIVELGQTVESNFTSSSTLVETVKQELVGKIDSIEIGGRNLLKGSQYFSSDYWEGDLSTVRTSTLDNSVSMIDITYSHTSNPNLPMDKQGWNFVVGQVYTVSVYAKSDLEGVTLGLTAQKINYQPHPLTAEWQLITWTFTAYNDSLQKFRFETNGDVAQITQPKVEHGNKATDWAPAPEDLLKAVETSSNAAREAAITFAKTEAEAKRVLAESYADGIVTKEEEARIKEANANLATAKTDATNKANAAKQAAETYAKAQADQALSDAKLDAQKKADAANSAAKIFATAEAEAKRVLAQAYADNVVTAEEERAIKDANDKLNLAKADATKKADEAKKAAQDFASAQDSINLAAAKADAKKKSEDAQQAAQEYALQQAEAKRVIAEAYADGIVTAEELARIKQANANLIEAKADALDKANAARDTAQAYSDLSLRNLVIGGRNLLITSDPNIIKGKYLSKTGIQTASTSWMISAAIPVVPGSSYIISGLTNLGISPSTVFFSSSGTVVLGINGAKRTEVIAPENAVTMKVSMLIADINLVMIENGTKASSLTLSPEDVAHNAIVAAKDAEASAKAYTLAENALRLTEAKAYADGKITLEEAARIAQDKANLELAKLDSADKAEAARDAAQAFATSKDLVVLQTAQADAQTKADEAKSSAKTFATAEAEAKRILAEAYADGKVTEEEARAIKDAEAKLALAKSDATKKADAAKLAAQSFASAQDLINLNSAKTDAQAKAKAAQDAAEEYALKQAEAKQILAQTYADGIVTAEEERAIKDANDKLAAAKLDATNKANEASAAAKTFATLEANRVLALAKTDAKTKADAAKAAAQVFATAEAEAKQVLAQAYADGKITAEEKRAIKDTNDKLALAQADATKKADEAKQAAIKAAAADATVKANQSLSDSQALILQAVEGIEVGGRNLIKSTDAIYSWVGVHTVNNVSGAFVYLTAPVENAIYQIEVRAIDESAVGNEFGFQWNSKIQGISTTLTTEWQRVSANVDAGTIGLRLIGTGGIIETRFLKAEKGNVITDWSPAPEDLQSNAEKLATEAREAAQVFATTKAEAERVKAEVYADGKVTAEEQARIAEVDAKHKAALLDATQKSDAAKKAAILAAATDAKTKADNALASAKTEATRLSNLALDAAKLHANTKAEAERVLAEAHADGIVSIEEEERIKQANAIAEAAKLGATKKADAAKNAAVIAAAADADSKVSQAVLNSKAEAVKLSNEALAAAKVHANAQAAAERLTAEAHADNIVTAEEQARIAQALQVVKDAKADAASKADAAQTAAIKAAALDASTKADKAKKDAEAAAKTFTTTEVTKANSRIDTLSTSINDAEQSLVKQGNKITSNFNSTTTLVETTKKALDEKIDGIEIGGRNLIVESNSTANQWIGVSGEVESARDGSSVINYEIPVVPGEVIIFNTHSAEVSGSYYRWRWNDVDGNYISRRAELAVYKRPYKWVVPEGAASIVVSYPYGKQVKVEKGNKATDWTPAPEDTTYYVDKGLSNAKTTNEQYAAQKASEALTAANKNTATKAGEAQAAAEKSSKDYIDSKLIPINQTISSKADADDVTEIINNAQLAKAERVEKLSATYDKTVDSLIPHGRNLVVIKDLTIGGFLTSSGRFSSNNGWSVSDFIPVVPGTQYIASGYINLGTSPATCFYDEDKNYVSGISNQNAMGAPEDDRRRLVTIPKDCRYMKVSIDLVDLETVKVEKGNIPTSWTPSVEDMPDFVNSGFDTLTEVVKSKASIEQLNTVKNDANKAIAQAKTELTGSFTSAITEAKSESATDAQAKASQALKDAKADIVLKTEAAQTAAEKYAKDKADAALLSAKTDSTAKANAAESAAKVAAALDAKNKADKALADAKIDAKAKADEAERLAKVYADGKVNALTKVVDSKANISRVDTVENDAKQALAAAKTELTSNYTEVIDSIEIGGRNLLAISKSENGVIRSNGAIESNPSWMLTNYIPIVGGSEYIMSGYSTLGDSVASVFFDEDKNLISGVIRGARVQLLAPSNAKYLRLSFYVDDIPSVKLEKGNKATDWTPAPEDVTDYVDTSVSTLKTIVDSKASISRVDTVENNANQAVASAKTALTGSYTTAISVAKGESATDAQARANQALKDAKVDATGKANEAERLAKSHADTKVAALTKVVDSKASISSVEAVENTANNAIASLRTDLKASYSIADTRSTNQTPAWYQTNHPRQVVREFKTSSTIGISGGGYTYLETTVKYGDSSGGMVTQQATTNSGTVYNRSGSSTTWSAWVEQEDTTGSAAKVAALKTALDKDIQATDARITAEKKVAADATSAVASTVSKLSTTVNGHTSSINETKQSLNGLSASWSMETNVNGKVSGIYQHSTGKRSGLDIITDRFTLSDGTNAGYAPFRQEGSTTYLNMAVIKDASIDTAKIANLAVDTLQIANGAVTIPIIFRQDSWVEVKGAKIDKPILYVGGSEAAPYFTTSILATFSLNVENPNFAAILTCSIDRWKVVGSTGGAQIPTFAITYTKDDGPHQFLYSIPRGPADQYSMYNVFLSSVCELPIGNIKVFFMLMPNAAFDKDRYVDVTAVDIQISLIGAKK